jgi:hypothetical protein
VGLDHATGDDAAEGTTVVHALHPKPNVPVVDEDVVLGGEHRSEDRGRDG